MGEFNKEKIRTELLAPNGIFSITTCPYVPAHNGVVERHWRTLTDATICQLLASNLSESYWEETARCANYIINRITSAHPETHPTVYLPEHKSFTVSFHVAFSSADDVFKEHQNKSL